MKSEMAERVVPPHPDSLILFNNGDCLIEYWMPRVKDTQKPHDRDEVYILVAGHSDFALGDEHRKVKSGALIFVPAGMPQRFFNFSQNLAMWIAFFGKRHQEFDPTPWQFDDSIISGMIQAGSATHFGTESRKQV